MRVYAKVAITDQYGRVLMLRRSATHPTKAGAWDLPGGIVMAAYGEKPPAAARREAAEETSLRLGTVTACMVVTGIDARPLDPKPAYCAGILCTAPALTTDVRLSSEHDMYVWADERDATLVGLLQPKYQALARYAQASFTAHDEEQINA